ncbi:MAG: FMN-binding protein [Oscillospiraceae bacterium]|nr:FMN-binding protein [Oscillospiraceae bacterium]
MKTKTESTVKFVIRLAVTLLAITAVVAAALAAVNGVTAPVIAASNAAKTQQAVEAVLPGGGEKADVPAVDVGVPVAEVYKGENGYAVKVSPGGFGGAIEMMVGVDNAGNVLGISIIKHAETPSLGAVAAAKGSAGENFRNSFIGLSGAVQVSKDGGQADTISGATITSRAVADGVNAALAVVAAMG